MLGQPQELSGSVRRAADRGMFAMMAMMMACCIGVLVFVALIPVFGWPIGIGVALAGGFGLMYVHYKFMGHGTHQAPGHEAEKRKD